MQNSGMKSFNDWYRQLNLKVIKRIAKIAKKKGLSNDEIEDYLDVEVYKIMGIYMQHYRNFKNMMKISDQKLRIMNCNERTNDITDKRLKEILYKYQAHKHITNRKLTETKYNDPFLLKNKDYINQISSGSDTVSEIKGSINNLMTLPKWSWGNDDEE